MHLQVVCYNGTYIECIYVRELTIVNEVTILSLGCISIRNYMNRVVFLILELMLFAVNDVISVSCL